MRELCFAGITGDVCVSVDFMDRLPAFFVFDMDDQGTFRQVYYLIYKAQEAENGSIIQAVLR